MDRRVEVAVIGAGSAGLSAIREIQKVTNDFVLINGGQYGTTCARVGCMPSKALIQVANDFQRRKSLAREGIYGADREKIDTKAVLRYVRMLRDRFVHGVVDAIEQLGDANMQGFARFIEPTVLKVDHQIVRANRVIIATGSHPVQVNQWQDFRDRILTSDSIFELHDLPESLIVAGLGVVGTELSQALSRLGVKVVAVQKEATIGGLTDPKLIQYASSRFAEEFPLKLGYPAQLKRMDGRVELEFGERTIYADKVLACLGRRPNVANLGLEVLGVPLNEYGIPRFNAHTMQVANLPVFLAGDINADRPMLHEAADEGRIAGFNSVRDNVVEFRRRVVLGITFSEPNCAKIGRSYADLIGQEFLIGEAKFDNQGRSVIMGQNEGYIRIYVEPEHGYLLGAELIAPEGEHLAHLLAWSVQQKLMVFDVLQLPVYHPVVEEGLRTALRHAASLLPQKRPPFDLVPCHESGVEMLA